jgi:hypothetical protein
MRKLTVAILGNHQVSFCTERELDWTFENLGHRVFKFQENLERTEHILELCRSYKVDLFIYVHTHGWETPGSISLDEMITGIRAAGIITCGFHLDMYWGLNAADSRQDRIGIHPFWHMDYVFTADGGHDEEFRGREVKHIWLPPAVVERGCFKGNFNDDYACDVAFVGSKGYHPEYAFRPYLVEWLERTYGDRFRRYCGDTQWGEFREQKLNDAYASVKVCVGDSCFGGYAKRYWSDRVCETLGRGGFLIHPKVEGLEIPGLVTFTPQNLEELQRKIDYFVTHEEERRACIETSFKWVRENETYTNRVHRMLEIMGLL